MSAMEPRRLPRNVWIVGLVSLFNDISSEMIYPLLPLFLTGVLKASRTSLGVVEGVAEALASLLKVFSGVLSDRFRTRKVPMLLGYGLSLASRPVLASAGGWGSVFGARLVDRTGKGIRTAPRDAVIADSTAPELRGRAFGVHRALDTAGAAVGPAIAALLLSSTTIGIRGIFWLSLLPGVLALVLIPLLRDKVPDSPPRGRGPSLGEAVRLGGAYRDFLVVTALFTLANSSDTFLLLKAREAGFSVAGVTGVYTLFNLFYAAISGPVGVWADGWGRRRVVLLSFFYYGAVYAGFALAGSPASVLLLFVLYGPFQAVEEGVKKAYLSELIPGSLMGSGMGLYHAVRGLALLPASLLTGGLWDALGPGWALGADALLATAVGCLFALLTRRRKGGEAVP
ncbi:MAG: MFS transporter [Acidobacteriota bacterium]